MEAESHSALRILAVLVLGVAAVIAWQVVREARRPHLVGVQVVYRGESERAASDAFRFLPAGEKIRAAALVTYRRGDGEPRRMCALSPVEVGGRSVKVEDLSAWPASGGELRALWYTVEPSLFGWDSVGAADAERVGYKDFVAAELGRELVTTLNFEAHNDDFMARKVEGNLVPGGTFRLKVRVGSYAGEDDLVAWESVVSPGADAVFAGKVPAIAVLAPLPEGIDAAVSRLFRLGCFTFAPEVWPEGDGWPLSLSPGQLVDGGYITTPASFAAVAAGGAPLTTPWRPPVALAAIGTAWRRTEGGGALRWGEDVSPGDALRSGERVLVLATDDGDGVLSLADTVLAAWGEPAKSTPLALALDPGAGRLELLRRAR